MKIEFVLKGLVEAGIKYETEKFESTGTEAYSVKVGEFTYNISTCPSGAKIEKITTYNDGQVETRERITSRKALLVDIEEKGAIEQAAQEHEAGKLVEAGESKVFQLQLSGSDILKRKAVPFRKTLSALRLLENAMFQICSEQKGVCIAAPQVGSSVRVILINTATQPGRLIVNPVIIPIKSRGRKMIQEMCFSYPGKRFRVQRWKSVAITGTDYDGNPISITYSGKNAQASQHAVDRLNGKAI